MLNKNTTYLREKIEHRLKLNPDRNALPEPPPSSLWIFKLFTLFAPLISILLVAFASGPESWTLSKLGPLILASLCYTIFSWTQANQLSIKWHCIISGKSPYTPDQFHNIVIFYLLVYLPLSYFIYYWSYYAFGNAGISYLLFFSSSACSTYFLPLRGILISNGLSFILFTLIVSQVLDPPSQIPVLFAAILASLGSNIMFYWGGEVQKRNLRIAFISHELEQAHHILSLYSLQAEELGKSEERAQLTTKLHRELEKSLNIAIQKLEMFQDQPKECEFLVKEVEFIQQTIRDGLNTMRKSVAAMRTPEIAK